VTARKPWSSFAVLLAALSSVAILFLAGLVLAALAGYLMYSSAPKKVEIIRYRSDPNSSLAPSVRAAPETPPRSAP